MTANFLTQLLTLRGARQFLRFAAVGAAATLLQYAVLIILVELSLARTIVAAVLAYLCGAVLSYLLNARFTFGQTQTAFGKVLLKFLLINFVGLGFNTLIFTSLIKFQVHYLIGQMVATGLVLIWNYAGARLFVFRGADSASS